MADQWVRLELDLTTFDTERFERYVARCRDEGIHLTTLAELGDSPEHRRALYELNKECSADIPERGEFFSYEEFCTRRFDTPSYDPRGVVIALDGDDWIGMAATSRHADFLFNEMTGVRASYRGRGVSIAMKTLGMRFAATCGVRRIRTFHHPANAGAIGMNRTMGYADTE